MNVPFCFKAKAPDNQLLTTLSRTTDNTIGLSDRFRMEWKLFQVIEYHEFKKALPPFPVEHVFVDPITSVEKLT